MLGVLPEVVNAFSELFDCPLNNISCLSDSFGTFSGGLCCVLGILMLDSPLLLGFAAGRYFLCAAGLTSMLPELSCRMSACLKCSFGYFLAARQRGLSLREAMEKATEASAICVTRAGAAPSIPRL